MSLRYIGNLRRLPLSRRCLSTVEAGVERPDQYCADFVRKNDYESFLVSPFYPTELRPAYFALKAFSVELAMVQDNVSNPMIGQMRMQFWRDAIKSFSDGSPPRHPIAMSLYDACQRVHLPTYHLKRIIDARDAELYSSAHLTTDSLTAHAEATSSTLLYLLLSLFSASSSSTLSHAASHLGISQTFATLLRALPFHAANGRMIIPAEITAKHRVVQEDVLRKGGDAQGIEDAVFELATLANDHLQTARSMFKENGFEGKVPRAVMPVFMTGASVASILGRLEKANFNAFDPRLQLRDWKLPWRVWKSYYVRMF